MKKYNEGETRLTEGRGSERKMKPILNKKTKQNIKRING